jgi:hypothetical protein
VTFFSLLGEDVFVLKKVLDHLLDNKDFYRNVVDWEKDGKRLKSIVDSFNDYIDEMYNQASDQYHYDRMLAQEINSNIELGME